MTTSAGDGKGWLTNMYHTNNNKWQAQWSLTYQYRWCCTRFGEEVSSNGEMATVLMSCCWQQPHKFCEHCVHHLHVSALVKQQSIIHAIILNQGGPARTSSSIHKIIQKTYKRMLIQNSRTCMPWISQKHYTTQFLGNNKHGQSPSKMHDNEPWQLPRR